jgi:hypothetical protein
VIKTFLESLTKIPKYCWALVADVAAWMILVHIRATHPHLCSQSGYFGCYVVPDDRLAGNLALLAAVAAILIPIAIVLWDDQFQANSLKESSAIAREWRKARKSIYLNEIVGGLFILFFIALVAPLFIKSNALFWCTIAYSLWVLGYAFYVAFYRKPIDVYELKIFTTNSKRPIMPVDAGRDLTTFTLAQRSPDKNNDGDGSNQLWQKQLSEDRTFQAIEPTIIETLKSEDKQIRMQWWALWRRYLQSCEVDSLIPELNKENSIGSILSKAIAYKGDNLEFASTTFKIIASRLTQDRTNVDFVDMMYKLTPSSSRSPLSLTDLYNLYMASFRVLFNSTSTLNDEALLYFPATWKVTLPNLNRGKGGMPRTTGQVYRNWVKDIERYGEVPNEDAVITTTEGVFPSSNTWLIAMFVKLINNYGYFDPNHPELITQLNRNLGRWKLYGHVGRVNTEWHDVNGNVTIGGRNALGSDADTIELIEKLGWIRAEQIPGFITRIEGVIDNLETDDEKAVWREFIDILRASGSNYDQESM